MIRGPHRAACLLIASGSQEARAHILGVLGHLGVEGGVTCVSTERRLVALLWGPDEQRVRPDVIVLGLDLPDGDVGLLMERLGSSPTLCGVPVLLLTARDFGDDDLARFGAKATLALDADAAELWFKLTRLPGLGVALTARGGER